MIAPVAHGVGTIVATMALLTLAAGTAAAQAELTVYTAIEAEDREKYAHAPQSGRSGDHDPLGARLHRHRYCKTADGEGHAAGRRGWGMAATSLVLLKNQGMLEPFAPPGVEELDARFVDADGPPSWTGMDAWAATLWVNTVETEFLGLPMPTAWADLMKPDDRGHIAMPNPGSSDTGFLDVSSWLQMMGEEKGWA